MLQFSDIHLTKPCALLYHKLDYVQRKVKKRGLYLSPKIFEIQMEAIARNPTLQAAFCPHGPSQEAGSPVITFDDGFANVMTHGLPVLERHGLSSINFLVTGLLGQKNSWDIAEGERAEALMDVHQIQDWLSSGQKIGAHTCHHVHLTQSRTAIAREEIGASKKALEDRFGLEVTDFAYPYGEWNHEVCDLVEQAGFQRAWTTEAGYLNQQDHHAFRLPRFAISVSLRHPLMLLRSLSNPFRWPHPSE